MLYDIVLVHLLLQWFFLKILINLELKKQKQSKLNKITKQKANKLQRAIGIYEIAGLTV